MRRISSKTTFLYKRIFPIFWFGVLALFVAVALLTGAAGDPSQLLPFVVMPVLMGVFGFFIMKKLVFDLVDEVWDDGAALVIRNQDREDRVALADIINVGYAPLINPPRVTLTLRKPSIFGTEVTFCAPVRFIPFATSPVIQDLIRRIDATRKR